MYRRNFLKTGIFGAGALMLADKSWALKYYPRPSDKKWAVIYGTWCGTARDAGVWISEGMGGIADVFDVREKPDLHGFDHLVIGGAIRANKMSVELQDFIGANQENIKGKIRAYFAVCGNMGKPVGPEQTKLFIEDHLAALCGIQGLPARVFLGRITKSLMDPETAARMASFEDYDNLKRPECLDFGKEILTSVV